MKTLLVSGICGGNGLAPMRITLRVDRHRQEFVTHRRNEQTGGHSQGSYFRIGNPTLTMPASDAALSDYLSRCKDCGASAIDPKATLDFIRLYS